MYRNIKKALLTLLALSSLLLICCNRNSSIENSASEQECLIDIYNSLNNTDNCDNKLELIIVSMTPRGSYAPVNSERRSDLSRGFGWYDIGLSKNGKEPIEYIWEARSDGYGFFIINAEIGDKGTVYLRDRGRRYRSEFPQADAENPPIIGVFGEMFWRYTEPVLIENGDFVLRVSFVETDSQEMILVKYQGKEKDVIIPGDLNITEIDRRAFTESGVVSVAIPEGVKRLRREAFYNCHDLTSVVFPSSLNTIGNDTFKYCESLTDIKIPTSVTYIGEGAFFGCDSLKSLYVPANVTFIGKLAFSFTEITVDDNNIAYSSREGVLFNKTKTSIIKYPSGKQGQSYSIPAGVTTIESNAFMHCSVLTNIEIPEGVRYIDTSAFYQCNSLKSVTIPSTVTYIGWMAFALCENLAEITIPMGVQNIIDYAFLNCLSLTSVTVSSKARIQKNAFPDFVRIIYKDEMHFSQLLSM